MLSASALPNPLMVPMFKTAGPAGLIASPAASPTPPAGSTTPAQMRRFYSADNINFNGVPGDGRGMTIAIVDAYDYPTAWTDLQAFDAYYNLPDPPSFQVINQYGQTGNPPPADAPGGWGIEAALDVQWAHVMAPLANIVLVEAQSAYTNDLFDSVTTAANLPNVACVSMSFGTSETSYESSSWDSYFNTPSGHNGVTFLAATGDNGTPGTYPAYAPNVVAVGGTAITYASDGTYSSETTWSNAGAGASLYEPRPSYQNGVLNTPFRGTPDISMDASPSSGVAIYDTYDLGASTPWGKYGGTSLATPMAAALVAVADQGRASVGLGTLDGHTQTLPALYAAASTNFHDITTGSSTGGASAAVGYDLATGIGSPIANKLVNQLASATSVLPQASGTSGNDNFTLTLDQNHLYVDWTNGVTSGQVAVVDLNGLTLNGSGGNDTLTLNYLNGNPLPNLVKLNGTFTIQGIQGTNPLVGKAIDLNQSKLFFGYGAGPSLVGVIRQYLKNGYNGGTWNGQPTASTGVIRSSSAAQNPSSYSVGYVDSADGTGFNATPNSVEVRYTLAADANLDGQVTLADFSILSSGFGQPNVSWDKADFNYDNQVTLADFSILTTTFGAPAVPSAAPAVSATSATATSSTATAPTATTTAPASPTQTVDVQKLKKQLLTRPALQNPFSSKKFVPDHA